MQRHVYEGFSVVLPDGWSDLFDETTLAESDGDPPVLFASERGGPGMVQVTAPLLDPEELPGNDATELAALAHLPERTGGLLLGQVTDAQGPYGLLDLDAVLALAGTLPRARRAG